MTSKWLIYLFTTCMLFNIIHMNVGCKLEHYMKRSNLDLEIYLKAHFRELKMAYFIDLPVMSFNIMYMNVGCFVGHCMKRKS